MVVTVVTVVVVTVCYGGESWNRERKMIVLLMMCKRVNGSVDPLTDDWDL